MKKFGYEAANVRRWTLILLNLIVLVGSAFPIVVYSGFGFSVWELRESIFDRKIIFELFDSGALMTVLGSLFFLMSLFGCGLHLLKLFGLFGEAKRNSRFASILLSEVTLAGLAGVPIVETIRVSKGNGGFSFEAVHPSCWALIAIGIAGWMIGLSMKLSATKPVFRSLARNYSENGIMDMAMDENAVNDERSEHPELDFVYEKNNIRRWLVLLLAVIMFFGLNIPVQNGYNIGMLAENAFVAGVVDMIISPGVGMLCMVGYLLILAGSVTQVMKLMGLFGDGFRNDRIKSVALGAAQACGLLIMVICVFVRYKTVLSGVYSFKSALGTFSVGFYLLLALAVLQTVLAFKLTWTRPVIQGASVKPPKDKQIS